MPARRYCRPGDMVHMHACIVLAVFPEMCGEIVKVGQSGVGVAAGMLRTKNDDD